MKVLDNVLQSRCGNPLVRLNRVVPEGCAQVLVQLEFRNPSGSVKDRIAAFMIEEAEKRGELKPGDRICEVSSGNTGISMALAGAVKGYSVTIFMPELASEERRKVLEALGADIILVPGGPSNVPLALKKLEEMKKTQKIWVPGQFSSQDNIKAHFTTTGPEIVSMAGRDIGAFVAGVGTGGTLMGVAEYLKKEGIDAQIVAVEPAESCVLSGGEKGDHCIEGIGDGLIPDIVSADLITRIEKVPEEEALEMARLLMRKEGILGGVSAGANAVAAIRVAKDIGEKGKVVSLIPDTAMRYFSTPLFGNGKVK